jgi:hypothetical protein
MGTHRPSQDTCMQNTCNVPKGREQDEGYSGRSSLTLTLAVPLNEDGTMYR